MKLKNLLFGTMCALAFTACSSDDPVVNPDVNPPLEEAKTTFSVFVDEMKTKADGDQTASAKISSLQALVFNESQNGPVLEIVGDLLSGTENQSIEMPVEGGNKTVLVVANYPSFATLTQDAQNGIARDDVFEKMKDFEQGLEADGDLTMNSKLYTGIVIGLGMKHYLGFPKVDRSNEVYYDAGENKPIKLYRNVARVKLNTITVDGDKILGSKQYTDLQIELEKAYILHGKESSMIIGNDGKEWGPTYVADAGYINGYPYLDEDDNKVYMFGGDDARYASLPENTTFRFYDGYINKLETPYAFNLSSKNTVEFKGGTGNPDPIEFYVYENRYNSIANDKAEIKTLLALQTSYSYIGTKELMEAIYNEAIEGDPQTTWTWDKITNFDMPDWLKDLPVIGRGGLIAGTTFEDFYCATCRTFYNPYKIAGWFIVPIYSYYPSLIKAGFYCNHTNPLPGDNRVHFTRYYTVAVGNMEYKIPEGFPAREDIADPNKATGILRNLQYNINLTITGEGYIDDKGDKGEQFLQTQVQVVPFGIVEQYEDVE